MGVGMGISCLYPVNAASCSWHYHGDEVMMILVVGFAVFLVYAIGVQVKES